MFCILQWYLTSCINCEIQKYQYRLQVKANIYNNIISILSCIYFIERSRQVVLFNGKPISIWCFCILQWYLYQLWNTKIRISTESKHNLYQLWTHKDDFMGGVKTVKFTFQLNTNSCSVQVMYLQNYHKYVFKWLDSMNKERHVSRKDLDQRGFEPRTFRLLVRCFTIWGRAFHRQMPTNTSTT